MELTTYSDEQLLGLLQQGSEPALEVIYARYWESLYARASHFLVNAETAKDCVQDVFIALWKHKEKTSIHHLDHYLHQSVRFRAIKIVTRDRRTKEFDEKVKQLESQILTPDALEFKELKSLVEQVIAALPADHREIFLLHREQQLTYRQISEKLNISVKTVEKKMSKTLAHLRSRIPALLAILWMQDIH